MVSTTYIPSIYFTIYKYIAAISELDQVIKLNSGALLSSVANRIYAEQHMLCDIYIHG